MCNLVVVPEYERLHCKGRPQRLSIHICFQRSNSGLLFCLDDINSIKKAKDNVFGFFDINFHLEDRSKSRSLALFSSSVSHSTVQLSSLST